ncbi:MAG: tripartite ATP-independent transporter DctM subunit [Alphaproteobacteria bacterium]
MEASLIGFVALFALLFLGLPIGFGMGLVGVAGFAAIVGWGPAWVNLGQISFATSQNFGLSVLPLFILMGNFITKAGLSDELYNAAYAFVGRLRGGLAMATVMACGGFSAVSGSSLATVATMAKVSMPPMRRFGYADWLASGAIAAGGTLGIMIPPSTVLIIYGTITETDIGELFVAGIVPGLLSIGLYIVVIAVISRIRPDAAPPGERIDWPGRLRALASVWGVLFLFLVIMGGITFGVFTPTEAAGIGAAGGFLFAISRGRLSLADLVDVLVETTKTTAMLFMVLIGAIVFSSFINVAGLPRLLVDFINGLTIAPIGIMLIILAGYLVLGMFLNSLAMMLLTVPILFPVVEGLGFDLVWFGIIVVVVIEIGLITPPIGMNVFVLSSVLQDVSNGTIFRGIAPFFVADLVRAALLIFFPSIALFLPRLTL